jgi:maltooligosyltrehalose trehalohydrolase
MSTTITNPHQASSSAVARPRRLPIGAEVIDTNRVDLRVWAPAAQRVEVVLPERNISASLTAEGNGYFGGQVEARALDLYQFRLDGRDQLLPDPASRYQPQGPHGPSQVIDAAGFQWSDARWRGVKLEGQVIYELHAGTFTQEGTWTAAAKELPELARLGITVIELMPIAEFDGPFGWGYDGVDLFAPYHRYGSPDDLRRFVDTAHQAGLGVILDVVYNHFGPSGNYLRPFSPAYFSDKYGNEWGDAINFDGGNAGPVREFFVTNAGYWIDEFHFDGLRLDATQQIFDKSPVNIMTEIAEAVRRSAGGRNTFIVAENEPQDTTLVRPREDGGYGLDGLWNDDFHHSAMVALTGRAEAYYSDTRGEPQELIAAAKYGYLFQGQHYHWQRQPRGTPARGLPPAAFVTFLQNHDQVANSASGARGHQLSHPGDWRALTAYLLLMPGTPMLFQGQEFAASTPFLYFAAFDPELNAAIRKGRSEFLTQFPSVKAFLAQGAIDDPADPRTFERCKLDLTERRTHAPIYDLHIDLLKLRRETRAFREPRQGDFDGAVVGPKAFLLRYFGDEPTADRLLFVNLGDDLLRSSIADPLVAPPRGLMWHYAWSSEHPRYGGNGVPERPDEGGWLLPGHSALICEPVPFARPVTPVKRRTA